MNQVLTELVCYELVIP